MLNEPYFIIGYIAFSILVYYIFRYILAFTKDRQLTQYTPFIILIVISPWIKKLAICFWSIAIGMHSDYGFDHNAWINEPNQRHQIVHHLTKTKYLHEKTKTEILELLGEPNYKSDNSISYHIGKSSSFNIDPDLLKIIFTDETFLKAIIMCEGKGECE